MRTEKCYNSAFSTRTDLISVSNYKTLIFKVAFLTFVNPASIWQYLVSSSLFLPPSAESCETKDQSVFCILIASTSLSIFWGDPLKSYCSTAYPEVPSFLKGFITSNIKINNYIFQIIYFCLSNSKTAAALPLAILCTLQGCLISIFLRERQRLHLWNTHSDEFCTIIIWVSWFHEGFITCCKSSVMSLQVGLMQQTKCFIYPWDIFHMPVIKTVHRRHLGEETPSKNWERQDKPSVYHSQRRPIKFLYRQRSQSLTVQLFLLVRHVLCCIHTNLFNLFAIASWQLHS